MSVAERVDLNKVNTINELAYRNNVFANVHQLYGTVSFYCGETDRFLTEVTIDYALTWIRGYAEGRAGLEKTPALRDRECSASFTQRFEY
jgi:hypothetical protein